ncbi:MAG: cold shock domain-containing protein [Methylococcales bacterium]|nr:cold shock domain-containing protein [Methylococcales bacterium]
MANTVYKGILKTWKDDRGFGFIQPDTGEKDIFIHISALKRSARRPIRGDVLYYQLAQDSNGKFKAINARIDGVEVLEKCGKAIKWWVWALVAVMVLVCAAAAVVYL